MAKKDALMLGGAALRGGQDLAVMGLSFVCRDEYLRLPKFSFAAARRHVHGCTQGEGRRGGGGDIMFLWQLSLCAPQ
ncbi:hypothetical protein CTAM01_00030 [Colletotrichum tamarilloi]|uniref:Uncharacterized protein n=1 Tax=Colletotrichum tamarilloi TaxID=1209934 RepID=A0ABQ9RTE7_9PEZI|nr:uncharacterized protein CTAM01_00030 [Colletotrichum tamarilloi]KAK1512635.1 hypothetical protein CTAM01_00030 [Colletotrichum tamarilloi]